MMRIPFQDTRAGSSRRWTDLVKLRENSFNDICDLIERCDDLTTKQLMQLQEIITSRFNER